MRLIGDDGLHFGFARCGIERGEIRGEDLPEPGGLQFQLTAQS